MSAAVDYGLPDFLTMPERVNGERAKRIETAKHAMPYYHPFLDDYIRAIFPHDLVLVGAPTGVGKTELVLDIAMRSAAQGRKVAYFALEAEPLELERRTKFARISKLCFDFKISGRDALNYTDWLLGRCDSIIGDFDRQADQWMAENLGGMRTFYRGTHFDAGNLQRAIEAIYRQVDLIVIDHLHYVDNDEDKDEHRSLGDTVKTIRDIALNIGKPILLVAHLRKKASGVKALVPMVDDFHGSSNITKIATQIITLERANDIDEAKALPWWLAPTFMCVLKDRRQSASPTVALTLFDRRTKRYEDRYILGRLVNGGAKWEKFNVADTPRWAKNSEQMRGAA